jgi:hypothetical protein
MKTINIKGKEYVEVNERLKHFRANHPKYSLTSEVIEKTDSSILILATIKDDKDRPIATGIAEEIKGSTFINKTSYVENCETSAWGRALANFGIGLDTSVASAEEVQNAMANQNVASVKVTTKPAHIKMEADDPLNLIKTIKKGLDKGKDWEKDIIPWLKKEDPKLTIKKINQIKSELNGQTKTRVAQKS